MKLGLPLYYAEAVPSAFFALLCLFFIVNSQFALYVRLGLIAGLMASLGWIMKVGGFDYAFHLRPDLHMAMALFAGFLCLETARAQDWDIKRVFAGAFLLTYASTVHYPGWSGWVGLSAFLVAAFVSLPRMRLVRVALAGIAGGCLAGIPYVVFHLLPNWKFLKFYSGLLSLSKIPATISSNLPMYREMGDSGKFPALFYAWPVTVGLRLAIPAFVIALILLIGHKQLRAMALGFLPLALFMCVFLARKLFSYLYLETTLAICGVWLLVAYLWLKLAARLPLPQSVRDAAAPLFAAFFVVVYWPTTPSLAAVELKYQRHEFGQLRALSKQIIGPNARVASIHSNWYFAGGTTWFDLTRDILFRKATNYCDFFSHFDAISVPHLTHFESFTGVNESSLYERGMLTLRGFMGSRIDPAVRWFWLAPRKEKPVDGFFWQRSTLFRFRESAAGGHTVVSLIVKGNLQPFVASLSPLEYWAEDLPSREGDSGSRYLAILLLDKARFQTAGPKLAEAKVLETFHGTVERVPEPYLQEDAVEDNIRVPRSYPEYLAQIAAPSEPASNVPLDLKPALDSVSVTEILRTGATEIAAKTNVGGEPLAVAEFPPLAPGDYRVTFNLALTTGGIWIAPFAGAPLAAEPPFSRVVPCKPAKEGFVFHYSGGPQPHLLINANNAYAYGPLRVQIDHLSLERVDVPVVPSTLPACQVARQE
jgi:hypothetical protein